MTGTLQSLGLFLLFCVFSTAGAQTAQGSPLQNISLTWVDEIFAEICMLPPPEKSVQNCKYDIHVKTKKGIETHKVELTSEKHCSNKKTIMSGGFIKFSVSTSCNTEMNEPVEITYNVTDLVTTTPKCVMHYPNSAHCSWQPAPGAPPDLQFFYILACEGCASAVVSPLHECPSYTYTGKVRSGCTLTMETHESIRFLFKGTVHNETVRNTYRQKLLNFVKLPPLNWTLSKTANKFNISWIPPDVLKLSAWTFIINYTRCDQPAIIKDVPNETQGTFWMLDREPRCRYRITIKAKSIRGETEWSQATTIAADSNLSLFAAIIIPLILAVVVVLTLVCCRKNKEIIFPKVPVPRDFLSDIPENNNKSTVGNLYSPEKEEEDCKITLVTDPQINKLQS